MLIVTTMLRRMAVVVCMLLSMLVLTGVPEASAGAEDRRVGSERAAVISGPPTLYRDPQHGSPVRRDPGDLLLIPEFNFSPSAYVVAIADTTQRLSPPSPLPSGQTAASGKIVPVAVGTNAVKVQLPSVMTAGQSYAIWVVNPSGVSFEIKINDARLMWLSPGPLASARQPSYPSVYRSTDRPGLNREIKIVGRNLHPAPGARTKVRLARCLLNCGAADAIPGPGYVDTLVFGNDISDIPDPWRWPEWWDNALPPPQLAEAIGTSLAIANGEASPSTPLAASNYPRDTVICDNRSSYRNGDFPPAGLMSTLIGCVDGIITSTANVFIDSSQPTAGMATFTVHLDAQLPGDVVVAVTSTDGNVAAVSPVPLVFTPSN